MKSVVYVTPLSARLAALRSVYTVFAITDKTKGVKGISAFIVERDRPGVSVGKEEDKMGIRLSNTTEVIFQDVHIPADHLIGQEGKGFIYAMQTLDLARPMVASLAVGIAQRAIDESVKYAKQRVTFGKPIIKHEVIAFKLADMDMKTEVARAAIINFLNTYYAVPKRNYTREAAIAKCFAVSLPTVDMVRTCLSKGSWHSEILATSALQ